MRFNGSIVMAAVLCAAGAARAQDGGRAVIRTETRVVLVDTLVTDKKGAYVRDLTAKDFRVWEDNKEQKIASVTMQAAAAEANGDKSYVLLFFDNAHTEVSDQILVKRALSRFLGGEGDPNRVMAVAVFNNGDVQLTQNFTPDMERIRRAVESVPISMARAGGPSDSGSFSAASRAPMAAAGVNALDMRGDQMEGAIFYALGAMVRNLAALPGRKALMLLTGDLSVSPQNMSAVTAAVNACNRANVAIYPLDVRGLGSLRGALPTPGALWAGLLSRTGAAFSVWPAVSAAFLPQQAPTPAPSAPSTPSTPPPSSTPTTPSTPTVPSLEPPNPTVSTPGSSGTQGNPTGGNGRNQTGRGLPNMPELMRTQSREILTALAAGTGGFVIRNTNDLTGGLQKIGNEQREYYLISYTPPESEGGCHALKVKVSRSGATVRSRNSYCYTKPANILAGTPAERDLEGRMEGARQPGGSAAASMCASYLRTAPGSARINLAMEIPSAGIRFAQVKGKLHAEVNILALAYRGEGEVAARFSDAVKLDFNNQSEADAFARKPLHYDNQFDMGPGTYNLKVAYGQTGGVSGVLTAPLTVEPYDGRGLSMSMPVLSRETHPALDSDPAIQMALLDGSAPMFARGTMYIPTGDPRFLKGEPVRVYFEIYDPELLGGTPKITVRATVTKIDTGEVTGSMDLGDVTRLARPGTNVIPLGMTITPDTAGKYRAEYQATAASGALRRTVDFEVN